LGVLGLSNSFYKAIEIGSFRLWKKETSDYGVVVYDVFISNTPNTPNTPLFYYYFFNKKIYYSIL